MTETSTMPASANSRPADVRTLQESSLLSTSGARNAAAAAWTERPLNRSRMAAIESHVGESLLDVGCGNGQYVFHYQDRCRTAGVDIQTYPQWETAPERFQTADACALPFEDGSFDTVVSFETLEHVPDPETALRELHRVSRRNVIVSVPNCDIPQPLKDSRLTYFHYTDRSHVNFYTEQTLAEALTGAGFASVDVRPINPCPVRPLIEGLFGLPSLLTRIAVKLAGRSPFHMTLLAVADRT